MMPCMDLHFTDNLARCIQPASIALVGASARAGSFGRRTIDNLASFEGSLYFVSATAAEIDGRKCVARIADLPEVPDCVILAVPRDACEDVVRECAALGVGGVVIYASGFAETGDASNAALQARIVDIASAAGMAVFGPNCLGVVNYLNGAVMSFVGWPAATQANVSARHRIGLVSQSGSLGLALAQSAERGVAFSHVLTYGNAAGLDAADLVDYLAQCSACAAIVCVFESSKAPLRLARAVANATRAGKPVIVQKIAATEEGTRAALSHTGSLAGGHESYRAVLQSAGAVWVEDFEALIETACFFAKTPAPAARGVAVIGGSGGGGILAADKAWHHGLALPQPRPATEAELKKHIPDFGSSRNPCDVTAQVVSNPRSLAACCLALAQDGQYGLIVSTQTVAAAEFIQRLPIYEDVVRQTGTPICTAWITEWHEGPGAREFEMSEHVAVFHSMDRCWRAIRAWHDRADRVADASLPLPSPTPGAIERATPLLARATPGAAMSETDAKTLLDAYAIPVARDIHVQTLAQAQAAALVLGYPVVLKVDAVGLTHKSDAGGVRVGLRDEAELTRAYGEIEASVTASAPGATIRGFLVSPMVKGRLEVFIGARSDAQFGPLVTVGLGGVFVEVLHDAVTAAAPVDTRQALRMLRSLRGHKLFDAFRGQRPIDLPQLAIIVSRASQLITDHQDTLAELDINPLICDADSICAVDALAVRSHAITTPIPGVAHDQQMAAAH